MYIFQSGHLSLEFDDAGTSMTNTDHCEIIGRRVKRCIRLRISDQKLLCQPGGRSERGIGYSFQLAITAPRKFLIGYGTATAQSCWIHVWLMNVIENIVTNM